MHTIKDDIVAFMSEEYEGLYLHAKKTTGEQQVDMKKVGVDGVKNMEADPWAWFRMIPVVDDKFAFESLKFPGYFLEDTSAPFGSVTSHIKLKKSTLEIAKDTSKDFKDNKGWALQFFIKYAD